MGERLQRRGFLYLSYSQSYAERAAWLLGTEVIHIDQALASVSITKAGVSHG